MGWPLFLSVLMLSLAGCETMETVRGGPVQSSAGVKKSKSLRPVPRTAAAAREEPGAVTYIEETGRGTRRQATSRAQSKPSEPLLIAGVFHFEEGNYEKAEALLRSSLDVGLAARAQRARAHKYLAFIYCVTDRTAECRQEFVHALRADPQFSLSAAEAGHPTWGPAFRAVQAND